MNLDAPLIQIVAVFVPSFCTFLYFISIQYILITKKYEGNLCVSRLHEARSTQDRLKHRVGVSWWGLTTEAEGPLDVASLNVNSRLWYTHLRTYYFLQTALSFYNIPAVREAIIEYPTRGPTYQGNIGHRNYLIFRMKMSYKKSVMTFWASIYHFYLQFVKTRPK